jgi:uncharacterized membrane protein YhdT
MTGPESDRWLTRPATTRRLRVVLILALLVLVALDSVVAHHPRFGVDGTFGFGAWFGFVSCVALVVLARGLGAVLRRPDTYYDR